MEYYCQFCGYVLNGKTCAEAEAHVNDCRIKANERYKKRISSGLAGDDPYKYYYDYQGDR